MDHPVVSAREVPDRALVLQESHDAAEPVRDVEHIRGLLLIGLFKLSKAAIALLSGVAAYHLTHVDPGELALQLIDHLPIDPVGRLAMAIMDEADTISARGLRHLGELSFVLAVLYLIEGGGLMAQTVWAEYLTVIMTAAAMPFEIYEMVVHYTDVRLGVLVINAAVVLYLIVLLRQKNKRALRRS